ncbi:MAG: DNA polymerase III subunit delta [Nitrospiraceae bacterium]|nr:MAG: DNA polymerase III subunit delta [Nitrospiraceae bacterium]
MLNKALLGEIKNGLPAPLYFLWSEEGCFLENALSKIIGTVIAGAPVEFNYDVFYPSATPQEIINAASTLPFMSSRRLVAVKDFHAFPAQAVKALLPYFKGPAETTCMVVLSQKAPASSMDLRKVYSLNIRDSDIPAWLKQAAAGKGIRLTNDAVDSLIEYLGYEPGLLMMELEKLTSLGRGAVSGRDVVSSVSMMREFTTFELVDSLTAGKSSRAFRILKNLISNSGSYELPVILGTLNWHYKQFYSLWLNKGKRPAKMKESTFKALGKYLPSFKEEDFFRIFRNLHEADLGMKKSGRPELVLETLLIKLLQKKSWN